VLTAGANISIEPATPEILAIGQYLADKLNTSTGLQIRALRTSGAAAKGNITLTLQGADAALGEEGYELMVTLDGVRLAAFHPAGLFRGIQTIRQLLPAASERANPQSGPWLIPAGTIRDTPRFSYRGAMLDVARHFFQVDDVKAYIDLLAYYKMNALHLHLTDDQGWRIMINSWPKLATHGGSTQVGGGEGGYYTQEQYQDIIAFAQQRYITIIPEIDLPGHTNAALASYPELNCDGKTPDLYTGIEVGFSSLCIQKDITYQFLDDVIKELAALTPGSFIHIGGDEALSTTKEDYLKFIEKVQTIVQAYGKQIVGWEEIGQVNLLPGTRVQYWNTKSLSTPFMQQAVLRGAKVVISPADRTYLDMKYDADTPLGLVWAGTTDTRASYGWDPAGCLVGVSEKDILGVEAPLWSETLVTLQDIEFMAFPRILGIAEIGWSAAGLSWDEYRERLAAQAPRLQALGVNYYRDPQVPWVNINPHGD
jgi:hexosaminidase